MLHDIRWTAEKIDQRIALVDSLVYRRRLPLPHFRLLKLANVQTVPPLDPDLDDSGWPLVEPNTAWIEGGTNFLLRTRFRVPDDWDPDAPVALYLPIGEAGDFSHPEALAYVDGAPYAACDRHHQEILLPPDWRDGREHALALHGWAGGTQLLRWSDWRSGESAPPKTLIMGRCALVQIDQPTRDLAILARLALQTANELHPDNPTRAHLYNALDDAFKALDIREPLGEAFYASVAAAHAILQAGVDRAGPPLDVDVTAVGHAHIDVAWLWTLAQTRHKAARTFHNVIRLMEQFPEFRFLQSQPQLYEYVRQDQPALFQAIQERVAGGQWEPIGGMWVEADCNLSGGESLARQFLLGRRYFREHFGPDAESPVLWLPDVFGYAWNLPQLIREAGLEYFFTIKIGWSQYNRLPYDSFWWQGLDGTRVLTHFSPTKESGSAFASTYNAHATPEQVLSTWTNFQQKDWGKPGVTPPLLMVYGYGDGGGGPTREMLENIRGLEAFPGMPRTHCDTAADFFRKLESEVGDRLPVWNGELYLEYHRGTYTTQARNKRANRKSEFLLHDAEFLAAMAATLDPAYAYPRAALRQAWELVCLNQFHDILPGSSIGPVYVDSLQQYAAVAEAGEQVKRDALASLASPAQIVDSSQGDAPPAGALLVNPTSFTRCDPAFLAVETPPPAFAGEDGRMVAMQPVAGGVLLAAGELRPYSVLGLHALDEPASPSSSTLKATPARLENHLLRVEFNEAGDIIELFDKRVGRSILPPGEVANQFQAFEDRPKTPDAWEVDIFYDDKRWLAEPADSIRVVEAGPLRATLEIRRRILNSEIVQRISLHHNHPRLDFETVIQWRERHILLKVAFPVDVLSPTATYEIQWGNVERPTHRNTSWDWARFETAAQKWVDLSEGDYGVSLLNDCKYGHDILGNVMRLTLLRGPVDPDPTADLGEHRFTYSLLPHDGPWNERTVAMAYALNDPLLAVPLADLPPVRPASFSFISVDRPNVVIETVKQAEDGDGIIVRLYECRRQRGEFTLTVGFPVAQAWRTNLLEENQEPLPVDGNRVRLFIKPYQIVTLRLSP